MQQAVAAFMLRRLYEPSFWLDKACIDQENIADGLRFLAVSVVRAAPFKRHGSDRCMGAPSDDRRADEIHEGCSAATAIHLGHI